MKKVLGMIILLIGSIIWGFAFVAQKEATNYLGAFSLNGIRFLIGALVLLPFVIFKSFKNKNTVKKDNKILLIAGVSCGVFLFIAANLQQFAISLYPSDANVSGRTGFITTLYVVFVPILSLFMKKKLGLNSIISVILATIGLYLLCFSGGIDSVYFGDLITLLCAFAFSLQIMCIDTFSSKVNGIKLAFLEFLVCGILSSILMIFIEKPSINNILQAWLPILYLGVLSSGVGYTMQVIGQQYSQNPSLDSILMSLESVFALLGGVIFFNETFKKNEIIGCIIMFVAVIIAQLSFPKISSKNKKESDIQVKRTIKK